MKICRCGVEFEGGRSPCCSDACRAASKREYHRNYMKKYNQTPEAVAYRAEYMSRPEVVAHRKEYYAQPEIIAQRKEYMRKYDGTS